MSEFLLYDDLSENLTYPDTFKLYFDKVKEIKCF